MCSFHKLLVFSTLIFSMLYRLTTEWDNSTCFNDLLCLNVNVSLIDLSHIEQ